MKDSKPRVLLIVKFIPSPAYNWGALRNLAWLKFLSRYYQVTLIWFRQNGQNGCSFEELYEFCDDIYAFKHDSSLVNKVLSVTRGLLLNRSVLLEKYRSRQILSSVKHLVASRDFEFILCSELSTMQYVQKIGTAIPVFFDDHNVEHDLIRQSAELFLPPLRQLILREAMKIKTEELASVRMAEKTFAVSDLDREALWWGHILTINNTFADGWWLHEKFLSETPTIIFVGNISWKPNLLWLIRFIEKVFPRILREIPNAKFVIAGSNAPAIIKNIAKSHGSITLSENVSEEDKIRLINRAWVGIVPLYFGWGTRIKILEYWSYWKTVVSTEKWAEWLRGSEWTIIAYSDDDFADWITKILVNPQLLQEYWKENYSTFLSYYSFEKVYAHTLYNALSTKWPQ